MCGHFFDHGIGAVIAKALPIAAAFIPGVGPLASAALSAGAGVLGSRLQGNSWGNSLKMGALSGLGSAAAPILGNAFQSTFPETAFKFGINGQSPTVLSALGLGGADAQGAAAGSLMGSGTPAATTQALQNNILPFASDPASAVANGMTEPVSPALANADPSLVAAGAPSSGASGLMSNIPIIGPVLGKAASWAVSNPIPTMMGVGALYSGFKSAQIRQNQARQLQQQNAAQDAKNATDWRLTLNTPPLNRTLNPAMSPSNFDYSKYGYGPEQSFFNNNQISPSNFLAKGGLPFTRRNGHINGPGGPTGDKIPTMLSDGEYVLPSKMVTHIGKGNNSRGAKKLDKLRKRVDLLTRGK